MNTLYHISVWLHVIGVSFWIGGMLFLPMVLLPAIKNHPDRRNLLMQTGLKFRFFGYIVLTLLLVTGISNMFLRGVDVSWNFLVVSDTETCHHQVYSFSLCAYSESYSRCAGKKKIGN